MIFDSFTPKASTPSPIDDYWYMSLWGENTEAGIKIDPETAMRCTAVYAAVRLLAESIASLPLFIYERDTSGKSKAGNHPLYDLVHDQPNAWQSSFDFRSTMQRNLSLHGNAYARIIPGRRGRVDQLIPMVPTRTKVSLLDNGSLRYEYTTISNERLVLLQEEVFHLRGLSAEGYVGRSPIDDLPEPVALSLAAEAYGARYFKNNATPAGWIEHPASFKDQAAKNRFLENWREIYGGTRQHSVGVLEDGLKYHGMSATNEDSQYLEVRKHQVEEIARIYNIPLPYLKDDSRATFANSEQKALDFVTYTIRPWLINWEKAIARSLILRNDRFFAEFEMDGLVRGDIKSRYEAYSSAITTGWMTRNEARQLENRNPIDGLDEPLHQAAMVPDGQTESQAEARTEERIKSLSEALHESHRAEANRIDAVNRQASALGKQIDSHMKADERLDRLTREAARRIATRETRAARRILTTKGPEGLKAWAEDFYQRHAVFVSEAACIAEEKGQGYARQARRELMAALEAQSPELMDAWEGKRISAVLRAITEPAVYVYPEVTVTNDIKEHITQEGPKIQVTTPAPEVHVEAPAVHVENKVEAPVVNNEIPERKRAKLRVVREGNHMIGLEEVDETE